MANVEHSALTGANIHEPKGIGLAGIGDTYVATGTGTGNWQLPAFSGLVAVAEKADFPTPLSGVITLAASTTYIITSDVDLVNDTILYSDGSNLLGFNREVNILRTNSAVALVASAEQAFQIQGVQLINPSGPIFNVDGGVASVSTFAALFDTILIGNCVTVGTITDCTSVVMDRVASLGIISATNSIRFSGTFDELFVRHCYFKQWTGNLFDLATDSPVFDIISFLGTRFFGTSLLVAINGLAASANVNDFGVVLGSAFDNMTNPITGILKSDDKWGFQANAGLANSAAIGFISMTANVTETDIVAVGADVFTKAAGTTTASASNERFDNPSSNRLDYTGIRDSQLSITANIASSRTGGGGVNTHTITFFKNGSQLDATVQSAGGSAGDPQNATITAIDTATAGDFYEIYISSDAAVNLIVEDLQFSITGV